MTLNSTRMARPPSAANNITTWPARADVLDVFKHQVKLLCQRSVGVGHSTASTASTNSTSRRCCLAAAAVKWAVKWAGHSVEVLYRVYAHCIDGDDERWHKQMEDFLG